MDMTRVSDKHTYRRENILRNSLTSTTSGILKETRNTLFLKVVDMVKELNKLSIITDLILLTKEKMEVELRKLKIAWGKEFDGLTNISKDEIIH